MTLLDIEGARIDVEGARSPVVDGLTLRTSGEHVLVLGGARALFEVACGVAKPACGEVLVRGRSARAALRAGVVSGAPLDPPLPAGWTPRRYAEWSSRLSGRDKATARALAGDAMERLRMGPAADVRFGRKIGDALAPTAQGIVARRAAVIAAAMATGAPVLLLEDPTANLPDAARDSFGRVLLNALEGRAWAVFAPRAILASPLALAADEAIVVFGSYVAAQGDPATVAARERTYALTVHGAIDELARAAEARGARVARTAARLTVDLGAALTTRDLMQIALEVNAVIVELSPLSGALA